MRLVTSSFAAFAAYSVMYVPPQRDSNESAGSGAAASAAARTRATSKRKVESERERYRAVQFFTGKVFHVDVVMHPQTRRSTEAVAEAHRPRRERKANDEAGDDRAVPTNERHFCKNDPPATPKTKTVAANDTSYPIEIRDIIIKSYHNDRGRAFVLIRDRRGAMKKETSSS